MNMQFFPFYGLRKSYEGVNSRDQYIIIFAGLLSYRTLSSNRIFLYYYYRGCTLGDEYEGCVTDLPDIFDTTNQTRFDWCECASDGCNTHGGPEPLVGDNSNSISTE